MVVVTKTWICHIRVLGEDKMKSSRYNSYLYIILVTILFCSIPGEVTADNLLGNAIPIAIVPELNEEYAKSVYNSENQEYLVVWMNDRLGVNACDDIQAQRISRDGALVGPSFFIAWAEDCLADPVENRNPDVVYNDVINKYLVVWEQNENAIKGRFISPDGTLIGSKDIAIFESDFGIIGSKTPSVGYASESNSFLVVWQGELSTAPIDYPIMGQILNSSGEKINDFFYVDRETGGETESTKREYPNLIYNEFLERFLIVWQEDDDEDDIYEIFGRLVWWDGDFDPFEKFQISDDPINTSLSPSAASIPSGVMDEKFLVVWQAYNFDIDGRFVDGDGNLDPVIHYEDRSDIWVSSPIISGSNSSKQFFLSWANGSSPSVYGQYLSMNGTPIRDIIKMDDPFGMQAPKVYDTVAGSFGDFLVVWGDMFDREGYISNDIYGQIIGLRIYLPLILN